MSFPDCGNKNVRLARDFRQILRAGVANGNGRVAFLGNKEKRGGLSDDERTPDNDGVLPGSFYAGAFQKLNNSRRRAGGESFRKFLNEATDIDGGKSVHVFVRRNAVE